MIFQYNALDYVIETSLAGELVFTIGRQTSAAPKLRYNLHDQMGSEDTWPGIIFVARLITAPFLTRWMAAG